MAYSLVNIMALVMGFVASQQSSNVSITDNLAVQSCHNYPGSNHWQFDLCEDMSDWWCNQTVEGLTINDSPIERYLHVIQLPFNADCEVRQSDFDTYRFNTSCNSSSMDVKYT